MKVSEDKIKKELDELKKETEQTKRIYNSYGYIWALQDILDGKYKEKQIESEE